jgi:hypothetical protein
MAKTYNTLGTVAPGDVLRANSGTAAYNGVITNVNNYRVPPVCVMRIGSGLGVSGVSVTSSAVTFGNTTTTGTYTEIVDTDDMHSASSNQTRITIATAGVYLVTGQMNGNGASAHELIILKNGTELSYNAFDQSPYFANGATSVVESFAVNDYVELRAQSATTRTYAVRFSAAWLGQAS